MTEQKLSPEFLGFIDKFNKNFEEVNKNFENIQNQLKEQNKEIENHQRELESHKSIHKFLLTITVGIAVAFLITSILLIIDYSKFTSESRQRMYDKLEQLEKDKQTQEIQELREQIKSKDNLLDTFLIQK